MRTCCAFAAIYDNESIFIVCVITKIVYISTIWMLHPLEEQVQISLEIPVSKDAIGWALKNKRIPGKNNDWGISPKENTEFVACMAYIRNGTSSIFIFTEPLGGVRHDIKYRITRKTLKQLLNGEKL